MAIVKEESQPKTLTRPVTITLESVDELHWAYEAFGGAIHARGIEEDSPKQNFFAQVYGDLNPICAKYRGNGS